MRDLDYDAVCFQLKTRISNTSLSNVRLLTVPMFCHSIPLSAAAFLALFFGLSTALEVSPDSPCALKCIDRNDGNPSWRNQSLTFNDMLPCYNWEYLGDNSTAAGLKFADCQKCQMKSGWRVTFQDNGTEYTEQDSSWFLCKLCCF